MSFEPSIDDLVEMARYCHDSGRGCSLLIGAGCSVTAEIPSAAGFIELIRSRFGSAHARAEPKTYPRCMAQLPHGVQRGLIEEKVDCARINWAHIAITQLMKTGFVDRVLTTNFDPLVVRACALIGESPAVYDFAASQLLKPEHIPAKAVFHLHGQRSGFVLLNTEEDVEEHSQRLGPLFEAAGQGRMWIVVGYSGENDPVFDHLARVPGFEFGLYWIGYKDSPPAEHVRERLLKSGKSAWFVPGFDADEFFVTLARKLEVFPPAFVSRPFSHLTETLSPITDFRLREGDSEINPLEEPRRLIAEAALRYEKQSNRGKAEQPTEAVELDAMSMLLAGRFEELRAIRKGHSDQSAPAFREAVSWSFVEEAKALLAEAERSTGPEAERLLREAGEKYAAALQIKPDYHYAVSNSGNVLRLQAQRSTGRRPSGCSRRQRRGSQLPSRSSLTTTRR